MSAVGFLSMSMRKFECIQVGYFLVHAPTAVQTPPPSSFPRLTGQNGLRIGHSASK